MDIELTSDEIVRLYASGELLRALAEGSFGRQTSKLSKTEALCVDLHNSAAIDILSLASEDSLAVIQKSDFFESTHAIGRLIPHLSTTATSMMQMVDRLIIGAGGDGAANLPNVSLLEWFEGHQDEARAVAISARQGESLSVRNATFALQALKDTEEARRLAKDFADERQMAALTALSRIEEVDKAAYQKSLALFRLLLDQSSDDQLKASVLRATTWIFEKCDDIFKASAIDIIRRASTGGGQHTRWSAALSLRQHSALIQSEALDPLIDLLCSVTAGELDTLRAIDGAVHTFSHVGMGQQANKLVAALIDKSEGRISLEDFPCFVSSFSTSGDDLARMTLAWLLSGSHALCKGLLWHFQHSGEEAGPVITIPPDAVPESDVDFEFVARKAVGWLILKPVTAASILVSLMRFCGEETADDIAELLGSMLLANYSSVQTYVKTLRDDEKVGKWIAAQLAVNQIYRDGLKSVPDLPELRPSDAHLRVQYERRAIRARESGKAARKKSVFMSMVKQSRILHGAGTLSMVYGLNGEKHRVDMPFRTIGFSVEMPRLETIDPVGFDMALRVLRLERRTP